MSRVQICRYAYLGFMSLVFIGMTVYPKSVPGFLGLAAIAGLIEGRFEGLHVQYPTWVQVALSLPIIYFLVQVLGLAWTDNMETGRQDVLRKITILLAPIYILIKGIDRQRLTWWTTAFAIGMFAWIIYSNVLSGLEFVETGDRYAFFGENAARNMHLGYFALQLNVLIGLLLHALMRKGRMKDSRAWLLIVGVALAVLQLVLTSSKMGFITLIVILLAMLVVLALRGMSWKRVSLIALGSGLLLTLMVTQTEYLAHRLKRLTVEEPIDPTSTESTQARRMVWDCAQEVFSSARLLGVGTGDTGVEIMACYEDKGYVAPYETKLGAHSQYLQAGMAQGLLGLLSLLLMIGWPLVAAMKRGSFFPLAFFLAFGLACISECILERAVGIHLLAVFLPLLLVLTYGLFCDEEFI